MPTQIFIGLILCNLVWSAHPIMGKILLENFSSQQVAWLRYSSALLAYFLGAAGAVGLRRKNSHQFFLWPKKSQDRVLVMALGFLTFCFSPLVQLAGLELTFASENAVIVAMEPLITAFLAWVLLKERLHATQLFAFLIALVGFLMLSGASWDSHGFGNLLILISMIGEAAYSILGKKLTQYYPPLKIFGASLLAGVLFLTLAMLWRDSSFLKLQWLMQQGEEIWTFKGIAAKSSAAKNIAALFWIGPLGTTLCYLYYIQALKEISVLSAILFLFLQPVAGAVSGLIFLGERLGLIQTLGSCMILLGLFLPYVFPVKCSKS